MGSQHPKHTSPPKLAYKMHFLWMLNSPRNYSHQPKLFSLCCTLVISTRSKSPLSFLEPGKPPVDKFGNLLQVYTCAKIGRNWCRISGHKAALVVWQKKNKKALLCRTMVSFPPIILHKCAPWLFTCIPGFTQICSSLGDNRETSFCPPPLQSECNIGCWILFMHEHQIKSTSSHILGM